MTSEEPPPSGFTDVDASGRADAYAAYLREVGRLQAAGGSKAAALAALDLRPRQRVADLGCGAGVDLPVLAQGVGPNGLVLAVDRSTALLGAIEAGPPVRRIAADLVALPLADASLDRAKLDRVVIHLTDPAAAFAEIARVLGPAGLCVATEPDWETLRVEPDPASQAGLLGAQVRRQLANPRAARELEAGFTAAGLDLVATRDVEVTVAGLASASAALLLDQSRRELVSVAPELEPALDEWWSSLVAADARHEFRASITLRVVAARRPPPA